MPSDIQREEYRRYEDQAVAVARRILHDEGRWLEVLEVLHPALCAYYRERQETVHAQPSVAAKRRIDRWIREEDKREEKYASTALHRLSGGRSLIVPVVGTP